MIVSMRTTVTLSKDVAAAVERLRRDEGIGPSEAVNLLVRRGLAAMADERPKPYVHKSYPLGLKVDVTHIGEVLDLMDRWQEEEAASERS